MGSKGLVGGTGLVRCTALVGGEWYRVCGYTNNNEFNEKGSKNTRKLKNRALSKYPPPL